MTQAERLVLACLEHAFDGDDYCYFNFDDIAQVTGLERKQVRRACRSLARKGLTKFAKGLWSDTGPAGAGYAITRTGREVI